MLTVELVNKLDRGRGIQYLLDEACKIFGNPIVMFDTDYSLIAYTNVVTDDPIWNEIVTTGTFCFETQLFFANECFTDDVANAEKLAVLKSNKLKYDRVLGNIFNRDNIKVANIVMVECNRALNEDEFASFETLADLITGEVCKDSFYIAYGENHQSEIIKLLIEQNIENKIFYSSQAQILYDGFKSNLYLAVVGNIQKDMLNHYMKLLRQRKRMFKYGIYSNHILMIMSTDYETFSIKRDLNSLVQLFEQENIFVGISNRFENLFELQKHYSEAVNALKKGMNANADQQIFLYDGKS